MVRNQKFVLALSVALVFSVGCKKKVVPPPAPTAPVIVPAPTAELKANPLTITAGDRVELTWRSTNAANATIDGLGSVPVQGERSVAPTASTTYHLAVKGAGGTADANVRVTVLAKPIAVAPPPVVDLDAEFRAHVQDIFFDYDKYTVRSDAQAVLAQDVTYLKAHPEAKILIGGYCDDRGSNEYNLALGQNRADAAKKALIDAGIVADRIRTVSYGKEKPFCTEATEACWQQNRRAGFTRSH